MWHLKVKLRKSNAMDTKTFTAKLNKVRISSKKLALVRNLVAGKKALEAKRILTFLPQKGAFLILKTLESALASAVSGGISPDKLTINTLRINKGGFLKRARAASRGRMNQIHKPTSGIILVLKEVANG